MTLMQPILLPNLPLKALPSLAREEAWNTGIFFYWHKDKIYWTSSSEPPLPGFSYKFKGSIMHFDLNSYRFNLRDFKHSLNPATTLFLNFFLN